MTQHHQHGLVRLITKERSLQYKLIDDCEQVQDNWNVILVDMLALLNHIKRNTNWRYYCWCVNDKPREWRVAIHSNLPWWAVVDKYPPMPTRIPPFMATHPDNWQKKKIKHVTSVKPLQLRDMSDFSVSNWRPQCAPQTFLHREELGAARSNCPRHLPALATPHNNRENVRHQKKAAATLFASLCGGRKEGRKDLPFKNTLYAELLQPLGCPYRGKMPYEKNI